MRGRNDGTALVIVYSEGRAVCSMTHEHDGGEAYMGPLLRKAVQYAKTQYGSGDIAAIIMTEQEMVCVQGILKHDELKRIGVVHLYYVTVTYDGETCRKYYHVYSKHLGSPDALTKEDTPELAGRIPCDTSTLV